MNSSINKIIISGTNLTPELVVAVGRFGAKVSISPKAIKAVRKNWEALNSMIEEGQIMYGVNTGIGAFGNVILPKDKTIDLSYRMVRAHASGVGNPIPEEIARACIMLRMNVLAKGYSGVRPIIIQTMKAMLDRGVTPVI